MKTRSFGAAAVRAVLFLSVAAILAACASPLGNRAQGNLRIVLAGEASAEARVISQEIEAGLSYRLDFSGPDGEAFSQDLEPGTGNLTLTLSLGQWTIRVEAYQGEVLYGSGEATVMVEAGRTNDAMITMKTALAEISAFSFADPPATGLVDADTKTIAVTVPYGTDVTGLVPTIEFEGADMAPVSGEERDFSGPVVYTVTAANGFTVTWTVTVTPASSGAKDITEFRFDGLTPPVIGELDTDTKTIAVTVPYGTDVTGLVPTIEFEGADVAPVSGEERDFSSPVVYTITAADGSTAEWTVTVTVTPPRTAREITGFSFADPAATGVINPAARTVAVMVPYGTVLTGLVPAIAVSDGAAVAPVSGVERDFTVPVGYTVTAEDGSTAAWTVTVTPASSGAKDITGFRFDGLTPPVIGELDPDTKTVVLTVPYGTTVQGLVPTITHLGKSVSPASGVARDFGSPVVYTVTAADNTTAAWTATVNITAASSAAEITGFSLASPAAVGDIDPAAGTVDVSVPYGAVLANRVPTITVSAGATVSPASGRAQSFVNPVVYTVTAENGSAKTWTVRVTPRTSFATIAELTAYLASAGGGGSAGSPVSLPVILNLADSDGNGWADLLGAINAAGKYVALDLSGCTMSGTEFDPGTANTGENRIASLVLPAAARSIKAGAAYNDRVFQRFTGLVEITGVNITTIGAYAFSGCAGLSAANFPAVQTIGASAFSGCVGLSAANFPAVQTIGASAFSGCAALTSATLSASLTAIGARAFENCASLGALSLPASLTSIGDLAFAGAVNLTNLTVAPANSNYSAQGGMLLNKAETTLIAYPSAAGTVSLPAIIGVGSYAFYGCVDLISVELPRATSIGLSAFGNTGTAGLTVALGSAVPATLGAQMFSGVTAKSVLIQVPFSAENWNGLIGGYSGASAASNWGNGFRGGGWSSGSMTGSANVNGNIALTIEQLDYLVVSGTGSNDTGDGGNAAPYATVDKALDVIRDIYDSTRPWPGKGTAAATPARIVVNGTVARAVGAANGMVNISDTALYTNYPPIILEGTGTLNAASLSPLRVLYIDYAHVTLRGSLTLTGGDATDGGGVYVNNGTFAMNGGTISGNQATLSDGGGVLVNNGTFTMSGGTIRNNHATLDGGGVSVNGVAGNSPVFTMIGGIITGNTTACDGGGVSVDGDGTFTMSGGTIIGNTESANGGGVSVKGSGTFAMDVGASIINNGTTGGGGGVYFAGTTFTMNGGTISGNTTATDVNTSYGGGVYVAAGAFTMSDGTIGGDTDADANKAFSGGGVFVTGSGASFTMPAGSAAKIKGNTATNGGGGVSVDAGGSFAMNAGTISGNKAAGVSGGGGVYVYGATTFTMSGGTISGNIASNSGGNGGGVYFASSTTFAMSGGTIGGSGTGAANTAANSGGGVYVASGTFQKTGGVIYGDASSGPKNTAGSGNGHAAYVSTGPLQRNNTAGTGIDLDSTKGTILGGWEVFSSGGISAAIAALPSGETLVVLPAGTYDMTATVGVGATITITTEPGAAVILERQTSLTGNMINVTGSGDLTLQAGTGGGSLTLDGNSDEVTASGSLVRVDSGDLTLKNGVTLQNNETTGSGSGVYVTGSGAAFDMDGGTISGNTAGGQGGGVYIYGAGITFTMTGGTIGGSDTNDTNTASDGGGVYVQNTGTGTIFVMSGSAAVRNNKATSATGGGGGVVVDAGTFEMHGGTISANKATDTGASSGGGGVYVYNGTFDMDGGTIGGVNAADANTAERGGGVYLTGSSTTFTMDGTTAAISGNEAASGGGVYFAGTTFTMNGGTIGGNKATGAGAADGGGGVYVYNGIFDMDGGTIGGVNATDANSAERGGGVYLTGSSTTFNLSGTAAIKGNTGSDSGGGGGVYVAPVASFYMAGGTIGDNRTAYGGGVCVEAGNFVMSGITAAVSGNEATVYGGGVYVMSGSFAMSDGTIGGSTDDDANSAESGGGVYVAGGSFTMSGTDAAVSGNEATGDGGGVYVYSGTFNMSGGTIGGSAATEANTAVSGGGVYVAGGNFSLNTNAAVKGNTATGDGGGVYFSGTTFTMAGSAAVSDNTATGDGGGVYYASSQMFMMSSAVTASISGNEAGSNGGGVYVASGEFNWGTSYGSVIGGSVAADANRAGNGGGVYVAGGQFYLNEIGVISGNEATGNGGGVYVAADGTFGMYQTSAISGNQATGSGGGVYVAADGTFGMSQTSAISNNTAGNGGGVHMAGGDFDMSGGTISDNTASGGGGVYLTGGDFDMSGGTISGNGNNIDTSHGGGVYVRGGTFDMSGGTIGGSTPAEANISNLFGGGVLVAGGAFAMSGTAEISGNKATRSDTGSVAGGGVYFDSGTFTMGGTAKIKGNEVTGPNGLGGGMYMAGVTFTMSGGTIGANTAVNGGGVYLGSNQSHFIMSGGTISGNKATGTGGGGVFVFSNGTTSGTFEKENTGGVIYGSDESDPDLKNTADSGHGHAVYVQLGPKERNLTADVVDALDSQTSGTAGGWE